MIFEDVFGWGFLCQRRGGELQWHYFGKEKPISAAVLEAREVFLVHESRPKGDLPLPWDAAFWMISHGDMIIGMCTALKGRFAML
jgi:hypothetical protein